MQVMLFNVDYLETEGTVRPVEAEAVKPEEFDENKVVSFCRNLDYDDADAFFTADKFPYGFVFYDFEVFLYDWLVVLIDPVAGTKTVIANDPGSLRKYYHKHLDMIWVGYNNIHYDVPILKGILLGMNPKEISDDIIIMGKSPWEINRNFGKISLLSYDTSDGVNSLKVLEAYMGDSIEETDVPFDIPRQLVMKELQQTAKYCIHDVSETIEVFKRRINDFNASMNIIEMFDLPLENISKTKGQLTALVVGCEKKEHGDEFDIQILPCVQLSKYKYVQDWFVETAKQGRYDTKLKTTVCGIPHQFGWGGLHGASDEPVRLSGKIYHADVGSYYPSMMIQWNFLTRNCNTPEKFKNVYDTRMALKKAGKKKEQAPYKIILNSQYGITKDKFSSAYDPVQANNICVNGQLMLLDLLEHLEYRMGDRFELIQSNTDGIIVRIAEDERSERIFRHVCDDWCRRTRMTFAYDEIKWYSAKDVNNYVFAFSNGKLERKGKYVKELSELDNNLPIVNEALVRYIADGVSVEDTINGCDDLIKFQLVFRVSRSYLYAVHNHKKYSEKTFRVFASKDMNDGYLGRCKQVDSNPDRFGDCPDHCFIWNGPAKKVKVPLKLDKKWYVNLARNRLEQYGYEMKDNNALF